MKRKYTVTREYDLAGMTIEAVLETAWEVAQQKELEKTGRKLTFETVALRTGRSKSAIHQYFRNPDYNPSPGVIPKLCEALDNDLIIEWQCIQRGGVFLRVDGSNTEDMNIVTQIKNMDESSTAVISALLTAIQDGTVTEEERKSIAKWLRHHVRIAEQALMCAEAKCTTGSEKQGWVTR